MPAVVVGGVQRWCTTRIAIGRSAPSVRVPAWGTPCALPMMMGAVSSPPALDVGSASSRRVTWHLVAGRDLDLGIKMFREVYGLAMGS